MVERQETRQAQEVRWDAQRAARDKEFQAGQRARHQKNWRTWVIVAVIAVVVLL